MQYWKLLNSEFHEKIWDEYGPEFGSQNGKVIILGREIYCLDSSGAPCRVKLSDTLTSLGYKSSEAYTNIYLKQYFNPNSEP